MDQKRIAQLEAGIDTMLAQAAPHGSASAVAAELDADAHQVIAHDAPAAAEADRTVQKKGSPRPLHAVLGLQCLMLAVVVVTYISAGFATALLVTAVFLLVDVPLMSAMLVPRGARA